MSSKRISFNDKLLSGFINQGELENYNQSIASAEKMLSERSGPGNDFLGWLDLPRTISSSMVDSIVTKASEIREKADILICVGMGDHILAHVLQ